MKNMQCLWLCGLEVTEATLRLIIRHMPLLTRLELSHCPITDGALNLLSAVGSSTRNTLTHLNLAGEQAHTKPASNLVMLSKTKFDVALRLQPPDGPMPGVPAPPVLSLRTGPSQLQRGLAAGLRKLYLRAVRQCPLLPIRRQAHPEDIVKAALLRERERLCEYLCD